ncbi:hypothetical protein PFAG_02464 [Plasmodium falciparum Santa Lucia]|uniref:Uncharacterized protein n=2 Tax=Plasmodium falciparum TaxID=5833 RepID=A0A0L7K9L7_PLAFX|nr:hypothetical protein PFAG_02464 [Plasmodium falciparum Santa Lucia]KOB59589.1 hypothetical protein PFHG_01347 [Plasmodium falciparum HB3]
MKSNLDKKKKKKVQGITGDVKVTSTEDAENDKRKASIKNNKNETFSRFLFPKNPRAFTNLVEYSFSNEQFVTIENIDHTVFHLDIKSCLVRKDSDEGKKQMELIKKKIEKANAFTLLKDNDYIYHKPKNCFDYIDRYSQTVPRSFKDECTKTEPQEINEICDTVSQSIIYDAYLHEFQKISNGADGNDKEKYNNDKKDNDDKSKKNNSLSMGLLSDHASSSYSGECSDDDKIGGILFSSESSCSNKTYMFSDNDEFENYKENYEDGSDDYMDYDDNNYEDYDDEDNNDNDDYNDGNIYDNHKNVEIHKSSIKNEKDNYDSNMIEEYNKEEEYKDCSYVDEKLKKNKNHLDKLNKNNETRKTKQMRKGDKKKRIKKESISGKHELYFINYKDINEQQHKQLNFIYHDNNIKKNDKKILYKKNFLKTLKLMDRIYNKNNEEEIYLCYKNKNNKNILTKLWIFSLNIYQLVVTDIKFHPLYEDLFAISFKNNDFKINMGILCCFTFKNTKNPEHFLKTNFHIHSIEWSTINTSIIIVGLSNGNICIYDLKKNKKESLIFESNFKELYNRDIISQIIFHPQIKIFYSVSYDGYIYQWKYNHKFTVGEKLLTLEKDIDDYNNTLNIIHTQSITCIDFNPFKINLFLIGTNKGKIYLYSSTYSDHYLNIYNEHTMSINSLSYNKFKRDIFISSSYDWTIRIWTQSRKTSLIIFDIKECVYDVKWSPSLSTCFFVISSNGTGKLHIYDLSIDINKEIICEIITKKRKLRKLCVNKFNEVILIGEENGYIYSYKISYSFNPCYMDYLKGKRNQYFQIEIMDSFLSKVK